MTAPLRIGRELARGNGLLLTAVGVLALLSTAGTLVLPWLVALLLQAIQEGGDTVSWCLLILGLGITSAVVGSLAGYLLSKAGYALVFRLRTRLMDHALAMRVLDVRRAGPANLTSRLSGDALQIKAAVDLVPLHLPVAVLTLVGSLVLMGMIDLVLLGVTVAAFAVALAVVGVVVALLRRRYQALQDALGTLSEEFAAALDRLVLIKTCRAEGRVGGALAERAEELRQLGTRTAVLESTTVPVVHLGQQVALLAVLVVGGARVVEGALPVGSFVGFLFYLLQLTAPLAMAVSSASTLQAGATAGRRFNEVLAYRTEELSGETVTPIRGAPAVEIADGMVAFDDEPALSGVDLTVPARGLTAIVGPSGAGKSTVLNVIERIVPLDAGRLVLFGVDTATAGLDATRARMVHLDQEFLLLSDTVRENLTLGLDGEPSDDALWSALDRVDLARYVSTLPDGLETRLGGAKDLSGGQRQRLAMARVLLSDALLVLLDEPTSQIDSVNEQRLRSAVATLARDRAVLMVAHRLSTVQDAATVIVMDRGVVVAQGTHDELLLACPEYQELVQFQRVPQLAVPA